MLEGLRGVLSIEDPLHAKMREERRERKQSRYWRVKKERLLFSEILLRLDFTAQGTRAHMCPYFLTEQNH